jgi:hypothetical protein
LLQHALTKDVELRLRDVADARFDLYAPSPIGISAESQPRGRRNLIWQILAAAGALAAVILAVMLWQRPPTTHRDS